MNTHEDFWILQDFSQPFFASLNMVKYFFKELSLIVSRYSLASVQKFSN